MIAALLAAWLLAGAALAQADSPPRGLNLDALVCPMMPWEPVDPTIFVTHQGERTYLCCDRCLNRYRAAIAGGATHAQALGQQVADELAKDWDAIAPRGSDGDTPEDAWSAIAPGTPSSARPPPPGGAPATTAAPSPHAEAPASQPAAPPSTGPRFLQPGPPEILGPVCGTPPPEPLALPKKELLVVLGNLHPIAVHFPIALVILAALAHLLGRLLGGSELLEHGARLNLLAAALAAPVAAILGLISGGWEDPATAAGSLLGDHRQLGLLAALAVPVAAFIHERARRRDEPSLLETLAILGAAGLVATAGHLGGQLVYGPGFPF